MLRGPVPRPPLLARPLLAVYMATLQKLLGFFEGPPSSPSLPGTVNLVLDIHESLLRRVRAQSVANDISAAVGTFIEYDVVPSNKVWHMLKVWREGTTANTRVAVDVRRTTTSPTRVTIYISPNATAEAVLEGPVTLGPGDRIGMITTGNAGDNSRTLMFLVVEVPGSIEAQEVTL